MADETDQQASAVISAFGGIRPMAAKLGAPVSTVQGWKQRDTIPATRMAEIREIAHKNNISLPESADSASETPLTPPEANQDPVSDSANVDVDVAKPPAVNKSGSGSGGRATGIAVLALLVAVGSAGWIWWSTEGPGADGGVNTRISALEGRIASLSDGFGDPGKAHRDAIVSQIEALRADAGINENADVDSRLAPIHAELAQLSKQIRGMVGQTPGEADPALAQRLAALEAGVQKASQLAGANMQAMSGGIVEFDARIKELESRNTDFSAQLAALTQSDAWQDAAATSAIALSLSGSQLRRAVLRGEPYEAVLNSIDDLFPGDAALAPLMDALRSHASTGAPTRDDLAFAFPEATTAILDNAPTEAESDIVDQILDRARRVVRVRRVGTDVPADSIDGRITRAELRLEAGDVAGAVRVLRELPEESLAAAEFWLAKAVAHIDTVAALESIEMLALERLRAAGGK
ncbi:MAG: hypothetical protein HOJ90_15520 [Alphaproteobacteria bacterium]|nr:hypothetical protein [Alphaproteobacteria bacterium]